MAESAPLRVLVVEDDRAMGAMVCAMLAPVSSARQLVHSGEDALDWLDGVTVDAVVTDLTLAGVMNGLDLVRTVRARWPGIRVVLITGWTSPVTEERASAAGAHAVLVKPFRVPDLLGALRAEPA